MRGTYSLGSVRIDVNFSFFFGGGGGDAVSTKVYLYGETPPRGPTSYTLICFFDREVTPLVLTNGNPFTYQV